MGHHKFGLIFLLFYVCFPLPSSPKTRKELIIQLIYHKSETASAARLAVAVEPLATSVLLFQLSCQSLEPEAAMAHLRRAAGAMLHGRGQPRGPSWQRVFTSPASASETVGWVEASVSAGFAYSYQVCSLVINILDLKFFLGKQVVLLKLLQWRACT